MRKKIKVILSGGGTGGHIYPAIAIANELKLRYPEMECLFVGAHGKMEMTKVPEAGYEVVGLPIVGLQRKLTLKNLLFPFKVLGSYYKAKDIVKKFKPDIVIGTGGYASGPTLMAAASYRVPTIIQEQNSFPGITNKFLSKTALKICVAYDHLDVFFPKEKIVKTGNPVRQDLLNLGSKKEEAIQKYQLKSDQKTILVLGGSLGAQKINEMIFANLELFKELKINVLWQTGKLYYDRYKSFDSENVKVLSYINSMDEVYAAADFIISRAGAGTISELCVVGKPVLLIPSPNVAEDHQTKNAMAIVEKGGALILKESETDQFSEIVKNTLSNDEILEELSIQIQKLAQPDATKQIVNEIENILN